MLDVVAATAITLGVSRWNLGASLAVGLALFGTITWLAGKRTHRRAATQAGVLLIIAGAFVFCFNAASVDLWVGSRKLLVRVYVVEATTLVPIADAKVELLRGPTSLEGDPRAAFRSFGAIPFADGVDPLTNHRGQMEFTHHFYATGRRGLFVNSGHVRPAGVWLRITCPGYVETYLPIDQQSTSGRDIEDDSPITVIVPVAKR